MVPRREPGVRLQQNRADHPEADREAETEKETKAEAWEGEICPVADNFQGGSSVWGQTTQASPDHLTGAAKPLVIAAQAGYRGK